MDQGEMTPRYPADHQNALELAAFLNNLPERAVWLKKAGDVIRRNQKLLSSIGKAGEIEKLHAEAADLKATVLKAIDAREAKLAEDCETFAKSVTKRNTDFTEKQRKDSERLAEKSRDLDAALTAAKADSAAAKTANAAATAEQQRATNARVKVTELQAELKDQVERGRQLMNPKAA